MTDQYYAKNPQSKKTPIELTCSLKGNEFKLHASGGALSKRGNELGTRTLIEAYNIPGTNGGILDLGCGYGPIGLALAKKHSDRLITMADVNERAVELAKENASRNGVANVEIYESDGFKQIPSGKYGHINQPAYSSG